MGKYRIAVVGIGGVGGYYGGKLAQRFAADDKYEVIFVARGDHKNRIEKEGLLLEQGEESETIHPTTVTDDPATIGLTDLILFCVKSYSLAQVAEQFAQSIKPDTVLLPLLNGVESIEYLQQRFRDAQVLWGCVYIISSIKAPGVVQVQGKYNRLVWGNSKLPPQTLESINRLFDEAGINHEQYGQEVETKVWEKFSFISPVASLTSLTHQSMGSIMGQEALKVQLQELMQELVLVAKTKGINLPEEMVERNLAVVVKLPQEATSSMEGDFASGHRTELENLTGYIVREAEKHGIAVPKYEQVYRELKKQL